MQNVVQYDNPRGVGVSDGELDLAALGGALWAKRVLILALTLGAAGLAFIAVNLLTPKYQAETRVLVETRENVFLRPDADKTIERPNVDVEAVTSQVQIIQSRDLALQVIRNLKLETLSEFNRGLSPLQALMNLIGLNPDATGASQEERVLKAYYDRLTAFAVDKSRVITIQFESQDPNLAARVANEIASVYLEQQQAAKQGQNRNASDYLAEEIKTLRPKVEEAEQKVEDLRAGSNQFVGNNNTTLSSQQLGDYNAQVAAMRAQKADLEGKAKIIRDTLHSGRPIEFSDVLNSDLIRRLSEQRATLKGQLAEQSSTLLPLHPRIKELSAQVGDIDRQLRDEADRLGRAFENDAKMAGARLDSLVAGLDQLKRDAASPGGQVVQLRAAEREAKAQRDLLESYLGKYREASARDNIDAAAPDARVISRAVVSNTPAWPKKVPTVLVAALAAFVLLVGFVLTGELLAGPVVVATTAPRQSERSRFSLDRWIKPRVRVTMPAATPADIPEAMPGDTIQALARELRNGGTVARRITVLGAVRGIGTTRTTVALGRELGKQGRVVLVDLAFGSAGLAAVAADPTTPGLADLVRGAASFGDIITRDRISGVNLVLAGAIGPDSATMLASPRLAMTLEALARAYDHVIIDAGAAPEAAIEQLARFAPRAVLVATDLENPATVAARERLMRAGFPEVTVVVGAPTSPHPASRVAA